MLVAFAGPVGFCHGSTGCIEPPDPTTAASKGCPKYNVFDHSEGDYKFRLVVPDGLAVVRGILVVGPPLSGDTRGFHEQVWCREFLNLHGFAFLGAKDFYLNDYKTLQAAIKQLAADSKHPELVHAPFAATGLSAGGGFARRLVKEVPDRVIAAVIVCSPFQSGHFTPEAVHRTVPLCVITGEREGTDGLASRLEPVLAEHRPKDALWGWAMAQGVGHEFAGQEMLAMPILDAAVRLRYPAPAPGSADGDVTKGPIKLHAVEHKTGWIADNTTWKSGMTTIAAAREFKGDAGKSSWLLNEDIAFIYRAYSTYNPPLRITSPKAMDAQKVVHDAGGSVGIVVDDSKFKGWTKLELYDGATRVDELAKGAGAGKVGFMVKDLKPGYHAYSVMGTDEKGIVRTSNPVLVVVRK